MAPGAHTRRLDLALAEAGLAASPDRAKALIMAGQVRVAGETVREPWRPVRAGQALEVAAPPPYVSRGGEKLAPALDRFGVRVEGMACVDVGASTGGFTDVLLQHGAARVYAVDVGRGQLAWKLRQDPRVVVMEGVNARDLAPFPEPIALVTMDVSFIGLDKVLPAVRRAAPGADIVVLFKPQFQVRREQVEKGGVVRDPVVVRAALDAFAAWCTESGFEIVAEMPAPIRGPAGNQEHLLHLHQEPGR